MTHQLYSKRFGELSCSDQYPPVVTNHLLPGAKAVCYTTNGNISYFLFQEFEENGIKIRFCNFYSFINDTLIVIAEPVTVLRIALSHSHTFYMPQLGKLLFWERGYNLLEVPHTLQEFSLNPHQGYAFVEIIFPEAQLRVLAQEHPLLQAFLDTQHDHQPAKLFAHNQIAPLEMLSCIDLFTTTGEVPAAVGELATQIMHAALKRVPVSAASGGSRLSEEDAEKIYSISAILTHGKDPLSLKALSEQFDISIYKINNGFKHIYGHSVLHHRKEEKMRLALQLMRNKQYSIKQLAYTLGYWPQNFSRAFKKRFGYSPGQNSTAIMH